jgi:predicted RNA-binding Zn ribbon-like protein
MLAGEILTNKKGRGYRGFKGDEIMEMEALQQENIVQESKETQTGLVETGKKQTYSVFRFFGEALAFNLVNTEIRTMKGKYLDLLGEPADLARWWREVQPYHPEIGSKFVSLEVPDIMVDQQLLENTKHFRQQIRQLFSDLIDQKPLPAEGLAELNGVLKSCYQQLVPLPDGEVGLIYQPSKDNEQGQIILIAMALSATALLTQGKQRRARKCKNERCIGMFYDNTKSATRYWCHINCKDRARAAERYQQSKAVL